MSDDRDDAAFAELLKSSIDAALGGERAVTADPDDLIAAIDRVFPNRDEDSE